MADTYYADCAGRVKRIQRKGRTKSEALRNLTDHIEILGLGTGALPLQSTVRELAKAWISHLNSSRADLTQTTKDTYFREALTLVVPTLGGMRLGQLTTLVIQKHIDTLAKKKPLLPLGGCRKTFT